MGGRLHTGGFCAGRSPIWSGQRVAGPAGFRGEAALESPRNELAVCTKEWGNSDTGRGIGGFSNADRRVRGRSNTDQGSSERARSNVHQRSNGAQSWSWLTV